MNEKKIINSAERFSDRVENYVKYRPGYPNDIIPFLKEKIGLNKDWIIADIGSGTGILSELFLKNKNKVFCVEPNGRMRNSAEELLKQYSGFSSLNASAESTMLNNNSIDLISAGQSFHWFDVERSKIEFKRNLKPDGWVMLIWNERLTDVDEFAVEYENLLLKYSMDYKQVDHRNVDEKALHLFFSSFQLKTFSNKQEFDFIGLKGRLLSST